MLGTVSRQGHLIVLLLDEGAPGKAKLFNLEHRTLRFTPAGTRYPVENLPGLWNGDFGTVLTSDTATLKQTQSPFSGRSWTSFSVGHTRAITFGGPVSSRIRGPATAPAGLAIERLRSSNSPRRPWSIPCRR